jgi:hypothetical protein
MLHECRGSAVQVNLKLACGMVDKLRDGFGLWGVEAGEVLFFKACLVEA